MQIPKREGREPEKLSVLPKPIHHSQSAGSTDSKDKSTFLSGRPSPKRFVKDRPELQTEFKDNSENQMKPPWMDKQLDRKDSIEFQKVRLRR